MSTSKSFKGGYVVISKSIIVLDKDDWTLEFEEACEEFIEDGFSPIGGLVISGEKAYQSLWKPNSIPEELC